MANRDPMKQIEREFQTLRNGDEIAVVGAAKRLGRMGEPAIRSIVELLLAQQTAFSISMRLGPAIRQLGESCVLAVGELLKHPNPDVRNRAAWQLVQCGPDVTPAVPALLAALDLDDTLAVSLLTALTFANESAHALIWRTLVSRYDARPESRGLILMYISEFAADKSSVIPLCLRALDDSSNDVRAIALDVIGRSGAAGATCVDAVVPFTSDPNVIVKGSALQALELMGPLAITAVPEIVKLLSEPELWMRLDALRALWKITQDASLVERPLLKSLASIERWENYEFSLGFDLIELMGPAAAPAVPLLANYLESLDAKAVERQSVARALAAISPAGGAQALDLLIDMIGDDDLQVTDFAATGLAKHGSAAVPSLLRLLHYGDDWTREWAIESLSRIGAPSNCATEALSETMRNAADRIRWWAAIALSKINGDPVTVPVLLECIESAGPYPVLRATKALGNIVALPRTALRQLKRLRRHPVGAVRDAATVVLDRLVLADAVSTDGPRTDDRTC